MGTFKVEHIKNVINGCINDDYKSIRRAAYLFMCFAHGWKIDCYEKIEHMYKMNLYSAFMRAYTRHVLANPDCIDDIAIDCLFAARKFGEFTGINE